MDAFGWNHRPDDAKLSEVFLDGAALSVGLEEHLFSWAFGFAQGSQAASNARCPADGGRSAPGFVAENYLCDGHRLQGNHWAEETSFGDTVIQRRLEAPSAEPLVFRLMRDEDNSNENVALINLEIWVR